jgi:hypothetical protein
MNDGQKLPDDDPRIIAWSAFKQTPKFANAHAFAGEYTDGSLWAAFVGGYHAAQADQSPEGQDGETRLDRNDESAVAESDAPTSKGIGDVPDVRGWFGHRKWLDVSANRETRTHPTVYVRRSNMTHGAWLDIDTEILRVLLDLPDNCEIIDAQGGNNKVLALLIRSPDIHPTAMRVKAIYAGAFGGSSFSRWQITAKRSPAVAVAEYRPLASFRMSVPIEDVRDANGDEDAQQASSPMSGAVDAKGSETPK